MGILDFFSRAEAILLDTLAKAFVNLSPSRRHRAAKILAILAHDILGIRRGHVRAMLPRHLKLSFVSACELSGKVYQAFFENSLEMATLPYIGKDRLLGRIRAEGFENLLGAVAKNRGVILISCHYGPWELIPPWLCEKGFPVTIVVRRQKNVYVDSWMEFMRNSHGCFTTDSGFGMRKILKTLHQGNFLALMSDQDSGKEGIFVRFFEGFASAPPGPAIIAQKTGAAILPVVIHVKEKQPHLLEIRPPIFPSEFLPGIEGARAITQAYTSILEEWIRNRPEQWFWLHRRWKTQP
ncbi:lysophospholipid acyltransferase family protein [bacterium]|nr:lysophospholipid acyltransferase family protein [bacterium]